MSVQGAQGNPCEVLRTNLQGLRLDHHKMQISDHQYFEKVFKNVRQRLNRLEDDQNDGSHSQCIDLEIICVSNESISSSWAKLQ